MSVIRLTDAAVVRIREMSAKTPGKVVRLSAKASGCSGYKYVFDFVETFDPHDPKVEKDGAVIVVDRMSLMQVLGTEVDWKDTDVERKFIFNNPMAQSHCGCGESFATN
jgi:iron-sulfur cluster assembly accessory protein